MRTVAAIHATDPAPRLEAAFRRIERDAMAGLPLLNPALRVQALGFARWQGQWLGALVTPWFLNLVLVPGNAAGWRSEPVGTRVFRRFGAGDLAFLAGHEAELGEFQSCSLISPMHDFADQDTACAAARAALRMVHVEQPAAELARQGATTTAAPAEPAPSRRTILFGGSRRACAR